MPARISDALARERDLRGLCCRILGWSSEQAGFVDDAMHILLTAAARGGAVALQGDSDLVPVAFALHRRLLGADRPFVVCDPRHHLDHNIRQVGFNIEELEGTNQSSSLTKDSTNDRVVAFFRRIYELQKNCDGAIQVREFDRAYRAVALAPLDDKQSAGLRNDQVEPFAIVSIAHDGSVSTFSPDRKSVV